jgi:hypothetical protein
MKVVEHTCVAIASSSTGLSKCLRKSQSVKCVASVSAGARSAFSTLVEDTVTPNFLLPFDVDEKVGEGGGSYLSVVSEDGDSWAALRASDSWLTISVGQMRKDSSREMLFLLYKGLHDVFKWR